MKKILVIGGSGFIGQHLIKRLVEESYSITTLIPSKEHVLKLDFMNKVRIFEGSITNEKLVEDLVKEHDFVINLAGVADKKRANGAIKKEETNTVGKKSLEINCLGELNILQSICKINPKCHHIFMGSRSQFGRIGKEGKLIKEEQKQMPFPFYGTHKKVCEDYIGYYEKLYNIQCAVIRSVGVYGPNLLGEKINNIISYFVLACINNEDLTINGDGKYIKDFIYIEDLIDLILVLIKKKVVGTYNVGSGEGFSMIDIANKTKNLCKSGSKIKHKELTYEEEFFELDGCIMNIEKVEKATSWKPKTSLDEGIKKTELFYRKKEHKK